MIGGRHPATKKNVTGCRIAAVFKYRLFSIELHFSGISLLPRDTLLLPIMHAKLSTILYLLALSQCCAFLTPFRSTRLSCGRSQSPYLNLQATTPDDSNAQDLKQKAEQLRKEISAFEQTKSELEQDKQRQAEETRRQQQAIRDRYSAVLPILKPDGSIVDERIQFPPYHPQGTSSILTCQAPLPLGLVLGESEQFAGGIVVDEVASDSHGAKAGIQVGDLVRAFTACRMQMEQPAWQLMAGGIGRPKMYRFIHAVGVDKRVSFDVHLEALMSNRLDPEQRPVIIVLERQEI